MAEPKIIIGTGTVLNKKATVQSFLKEHFSKNELLQFLVSDNAGEILAIAQATPHCVVLLEKPWSDGTTATTMAHQIKCTNPTAKVYQHMMHPISGSNAEIFDGIVMVYPVDQLVSFIWNVQKPIRVSVD